MCTHAQCTLFSSTGPVWLAPASPAGYPSGGTVVGLGRGGMDQDLLLAWCLQAEEEEVAAQDAAVPFSAGNLSSPAVAPGKELSVVDPSWELLDPSPDIRGLFLQFNQLFFWGKLAGVEVKWSSRMTLCAGVCSYEGRGGLCSIRLSVPLLKLRPRKDLVETLLHEMIHALLFVTHNNRDHDAHGEEFCKHMRRINGITGAKISVYHNFHDEVDEYRKHWWLCNGPCQKTRPYFGYVKRAMNRAPSANDPWWAEHKQTCGGTFTKIKEPENYAKKGNGKSGLPSTQNQKIPSTENKKIATTQKLSIHTTQTLTIPKDKGNSADDDVQTIIPFSGKGYKLGESNIASCWAKTTNPGNILKPVIVPSNSKPQSHIKMSQNSPKKPTNRTLTNPGKTDGNGIIIVKKPKVSVANTKVFKNINGSPVKIIPAFGSRKTANPLSTKDKQSVSSSNLAKKNILFDISEPSSKTPSTSGSPRSSKPTFPVFGNITSDSRLPKERQSFPSSSISQKRTSDHTTETTVKTPSASQGSPNIWSQPHKRPKMEHTTTITDFFAKPPSAVARISGSGNAIIGHCDRRAEEAGSTVQASSSDQVTKVSCPICQAQVLESKINDHLDGCLTDSFLSEEPIF